MFFEYLMISFVNIILYKGYLLIQTLNKNKVQSNKINPEKNIDINTDTDIKHKETFINTFKNNNINKINKINKIRKDYNDLQIEIKERLNQENIQENLLNIEDSELTSPIGNNNYNYSCKINLLKNNYIDLINKYNQIFTEENRLIVILPLFFSFKTLLYTNLNNILYNYHKGFYSHMLLNSINDDDDNFIFEFELSTKIDLI